MEYSLHLWYLLINFINTKSLNVKIQGRNTLGLMKRDHVDQILAQWRRERPDQDASPMGIVGRVKRLSRVFDQETTQTFARHGLEPREFDVLATLRRSGAPYRLAAGQLGRALMITSGTVTNRIDGLEAAELVRRTDDPGDRRGVLVELTPKGLKQVDAVLEHHLETERRLLATLTGPQQGQLADLLRRLLLAHGDSEPIVTPRDS